MNERGSTANEQERHAKLVRTFSSIASAGVLAFLILRWVEGVMVMVGILSLSLCFTLTGLALAWRGTKTRLAAHITLIGGMLVVGVSHFLDGLIESASLWLIAVIPVTAGLLIGARGIVLHSILAIGFVTAAWLGPSLGVVYPEQIVLYPIDWIIMRAIALVIVFVVGTKTVQETEAKVLRIARQKVEVERAHQQAQCFDAEKTRFLNQMSHEIRTPMNGIKGMAQHWSRQSISGELKESVDVMNRCADHLMSLMSDIQDLSKIESGNVEIFAQPFLVNAAVSDVARIFDAKAKSKGLCLECIGPTQDVWVLGDRQRLVQVLSNLVGNAVKFTDKGSVRIEWSHQKDGSAHFSVIDQGIGMTESQVSGLFQKFGQVDLDQGVARGGTGLGLTISKAISEAMGGEIKVTSQVGQGSNFALTLKLPITEVPRSHAPTIGRDSEVSAGLRVLVVDDDAASVMVQRLALEAMGCEVRCSLSSSDGIQAADETAYDLILMDLRMPGRDGYEATQQISAQSSLNRNTPIIALTASSYLEDRKRCLDLGMLEVIVKPFDFETLKRSVELCKELKEQKSQKAQVA